MILITTAMSLEARPLAERLDLSCPEKEPFPVFRNADFILVVSGTGKARASCATGWALGRHPDIQAAVNVGFCGAPENVAPLHRWSLVHAIRDLPTGRLSIPDILWKHPFPETSLLTVPKVVRKDSGESALVDMEGSGFFEAARQFLATDRILLLKWVSDALTGVIDIDETAVAYAASLDPVVEFLKELASTLIATSSQDLTPGLEAVSRRIRLTETQTHFLKSWLPGYLARGGKLATILQGLPERPPTSKRENNKLFERMTHALKG